MQGVSPARYSTLWNDPHHGGRRLDNGIVLARVTSPVLMTTNGCRDAWKRPVRWYSTDVCNTRCEL